MPIQMQTQRHPAPPLRRRARRRGTALITTLAILLGVSILSLGIMSLTGGALQMARRRTESNAAFNMAESGVDLALIWLGQQPGPPTASSLHPLVNFFGNTGGVIANPLGDPNQVGSSVTVTISEDVTNASDVSSTGVNNQKHYVIEAVGRSAAGMTEVVRVYVQQTSFGKYAFFTNQDPSNLTWVAGRSSFDGPVHTNNADGGHSNVLWTDNTPIYKYLGNDAFTYGNTPYWFYNNPSNNSSTYQPPGSNDWTSIASYGAAGVHQSASIAMPTASTDQQDAALGLPKNTPPGGSVPSASGVSVIPGGGVYIHCASTAQDVQQMVLSVDSHGNQVVTVQQASDAGVLTQTVVTLDKTISPGVTHVQSGPYNAASQSFQMASLPDAGATNGVIYCDGSIGSTGSGNYNTSTPGQGLSGVIANQQGLTIATDQSKNINLNGSVVYQTPRAKDAQGNMLPENDPANATFLQQAGTLGLVCNTVQLVDNTASGSALGNVELDATVLAYNTLQAVDYAQRAPYTFFCMGGEVANQRGTLGQFNAYTRAMISGFSGTYSYDNRLAVNPPPYFPTTSHNYDIISWQRVTATLP